MNNHPKAWEVLDSVDKEWLSYEGRRVSICFFDEKEEGVVDKVDTHRGVLYVWLDCPIPFEHEDLEREGRPYLQIDFKDIYVKCLELI